jgi:hypothetical protein
MTVLLINILGWTGVAMLLLAYALVSTRRCEGDSVSYQTLNIIGALLLIVNSCFFGAYPSVGVNIAWIVIALFTLIKILRKQKIPTHF